MLRIVVFDASKEVPESVLLKVLNACMSVPGMQLKDGNHAVIKIKERLEVKGQASDEFFVHEGGHHIAIHIMHNGVATLTVKLVDLEDSGLVMGGFSDDLCKERFGTLLIHFVQSISKK
ncbi:hypothetical protein HAQ01_06890 [Acidithiobacillus thiooxidans]|uniref:hypothetical protein n=1 Tax=Acidithiobacillus thiooxidans TaxID=930 RepID=UPI001C06DAFA|nr:hypothetical protein [Acidithiobacillus thiooxidans]MBU2793115.1 hypothetical protein [Acidithiobacillus thiooxidans]